MLPARTQPSAGRALPPGERNNWRTAASLEGVTRTAFRGRPGAERRRLRPPWAPPPPGLGQFSSPPLRSWSAAGARAGPASGTSRCPSRPALSAADGTGPGGLGQRVSGPQRRAATRRRSPGPRTAPTPPASASSGPRAACLAGAPARTAHARRCPLQEAVVLADRAARGSVSTDCPPPPPGTRGRGGAAGLRAGGADARASSPGRGALSWRAQHEPLRSPPVPSAGRRAWARGFGPWDGEAA